MFTLSSLALQEAEEGVAITTYGKGQLAGLTYTVPAHGIIDVNFKLKLQCVTPESIFKMDQLIKSLIDASRYDKYESISKTSVSGGVSFFGFWSGGARASYEETKTVMHGWGLSEENQKILVTEMMKLANTLNEINYSGKIDNSQYDYPVSGNLFAIVMDCTITQDNVTHSIRTIAPKPVFVSLDGTTLPIIGALYDESNEDPEVAG